MWQALLGMVANRMVQGVSNREQHNYQKEIMATQNQYQKDMWDYTNQKGQMGMLKSAGLNPGLIYGMGGGAGGQLGSAAGNTNTQGMHFDPNMMMMGSQMEQMAAQTRLLNVQADKLAGADTENVKAGTEYQKQQTLNAKIQADIMGLEKTLKEGTLDANIENIGLMNQRMRADIQNQVTANEIQQATADEMIKMAEAQLIGLGIENELKRANVNLTDKQIWKISQDAEQGWKSLSIQERNTLINEYNAYTNRMNTNINEYNAYTGRQNANANTANAMTNSYNAMTTAGRLAFDKWMHDITDSGKINMESARMVGGRVLDKLSQKPGGGEAKPFFTPKK